MPSDNNYKELISITLGVFRDSVSSDISTGGRANFSYLFQYLLDYFSNRRRCLGIGEYFKYGDAKFKVLGAFPTYGIVGKNTAIYCSQLLNTHFVNKLHVLPINGPLVNPDIFNRTISPFFKHRPRHITPGQYLYLNRQEYMITASQPNDGVVSNTAQFYFEGEPIQTIQTLTLVPYFEELPPQYRTLSKEVLIEEIVNYYLMPYFQGFKRLACQGQDIMIEGVNFLVEYSYPSRGVTLESTGIIYEGSFKSRHMQPEIMFIPRNGYMSPQITDLNRQLFQLQLLMQGLEIPQEQTDQRIIESLPSRSLTSIPSNPEASRCMICLNDYQIGDVVTTLPCFHMFHPECITEWLNRSKLCPLCKTSVEIIG